MSAPRQLRAWQRTALNAYRQRRPRDFLVVATPGAGKTTFALQAAGGLFLDDDIEQLVVVAPTEHLKRQWADSAHNLGMAIDPEFSNSTRYTTRDYLGVAVTYAQVARAPELYDAAVRAKKTLVILDEVHHAGDNLSWGDGVRTAFAGAARRLSLSGTPFRSDQNPISFLRYEEDADGARRSIADYTYGYADALGDGVVRPVVFLAYSGNSKWLDAEGNELSAALNDPLTKDQTGRAWRTALDPAGDWIPSVLEAADRRLTEVRSGGMADAGGLVLASNMKHARAYAKILNELTGEKPTIILSDDPASSDKIAEFSASTDRWAIAVRQVSEGVDVARLAVGVYATNIAAPLFFAQAVGRFVRARAAGETATVFLPAVPPLMRLAAELERQRDHVLGNSAGEDTEDGLLDDGLLEEANRLETYADTAPAFQALEASAHLDRAIYNGNEFGPSEGATAAVEGEFLTLPGMVSADDIAALLAERVRAQQAYVTADGTTAAPVPLHRQISDARRELQKAVGAYVHRSGEQHAAVHAKLRSYCGGPPATQATLEELKARIAALHSWS